MKYCPHIDRDLMCDLNGLICPFEDAENCLEVCEEELLDDYDREAADDAKYHERKEG